MKTHFALFLPLLPSITQGKHVNLRGTILQDEPKSARHLHHCLSIEEAMGWFGATADIQCTSNSDCTNPGEKCLVDSNGLKFFCGDPIIWDQDHPLCDENRDDPVPTDPQPIPDPQPSSPPPTPPPASPSPPTPPKACISFEEAYGYYGETAENALGILCRSNTDCTTPGEKCLVEINGFEFFCGNPSVWELDIPLCDD